MIAFIIYYSDLSNKIHRFLWVLVPLPLILSHEMMSYMAWPLIFLCWNKLQRERKKSLINQAFIIFSILFFLIASFVQLYLMLFHSFLFDTAIPQLISIYTKKPEISLIPVFIALLGSFSIFIRYSIGHPILKILGVISFFLFLYFFIAVLYFSLKNEFLLPAQNIYYFRLYPPTLGIISSLLFWWIYESRQMDINKISKTFLFSCICCCLSLLFYRLHFDYMYYNRAKKLFITQLGECKGLLTWDTFTRERAIDRWDGFL